ncbi:hypothetical protein BH24ACT14_BH24ACT14_04470 [soil metagenome]
MTALPKQTAREDFQRRIGRRSQGPAAGAAADPGAALAAPVGLRAPSRLRAEDGRGQVSLRWRPVPAAMGYLVERAEPGSQAFTAVDHGGRDVLAFPAPHYADTTGEPGRRYRYRVRAIADLEHEPGPPSSVVEGGSLKAGEATVAVRVCADAPAAALQRVWHMIGSERLSQLADPVTLAGHPVAEEFADSLRIACDQLGAERVRAHAILHDDLGVYREVDGEPHYDFSRVDGLYDQILAIGLRPVVELSFMPRDLAAQPDQTVFEYGGIISPPRDWDRWGELCARLAGHLVERYGLDEVATWSFEVWNEPNLEVFWTGSQAEYFRLYDTAANAIKAVDERLLVGGPSTAAAGWVGAFCDHVLDEQSPLDFLSTHTYGNAPLNVREALRVRTLDDVAVWWTEWGVTPTHFFGVTDGAFGAPFVLHGMKHAQDNADALAYWVISDHFEELGRAPRLLHGGFGLLTIGNLRKPRFWALALAEQLDDQLCEVELGGDGAGTLIDAWASRADDGRVDVLAWNGTFDQSKAASDPLLQRRLMVTVSGLDAAAYQVTIARVDTRHSSIAAHWDPDKAWPDASEWTTLRAADRLDVEDLGTATPAGGCVELELQLPMPGVARIRLQPR